MHSLPPEIINVETVIWKGNPLSFIPESFHKEDWEKMREYLSSVSEGSTSWQEVKLLLVGQEGVGKTTLLTALKNNKHKADCKVNLSTDGIQISRSIKLTSNSNIRFNAWDLGGQEIFYPTHQFFLTSNSIYLLVFNIVELNEGRMEYWMRLIKTLSQNSKRAPIFIVGTHADHPSLIGNEELQNRLQKVSSLFSTSSFRGLQSIHSVSCKSGIGIPELKERIENYIANETNIFKSRISESWCKLYDLISLKRESGVDKITWQTYCEWVHDSGVPESELNVCTDFLKDNGCIIHFNDNKATSNSSNQNDMLDFVILNPQWLSQLMSSLITFKHNWVKNGLIPRINLKQHIFAAYPQEIHEQLISLLEKFSVIYQSKNQDDMIIVPSLLPEILDKQHIQILNSFWLKTCPDDMIEYGRSYIFPFLPLGFFEKIIVRIIHSKSIVAHIIWRSGLYAKFNNQIAKLIYLQEKNEFQIFIREPKNEIGFKRELLLREITDSVDTLMECFYRMDSDIERIIPCSHCLTLGNYKDTTLFYYDSIIESITTNKPLLCGENHEKVSVNELAPDISFSDMIVIPSDQLKIGVKLGEGGFGAVYLGVYQTKPVAVKELLNKESSDNSKNNSFDDSSHSNSKNSELTLQFSAFQQEAFVMSCLHHPNIVKLYGISVSPLRMVLELIPCGDLFDLLHPKNPQTKERENISRIDFAWDLRLRIALDIARGMSYLQSFSPPIVHRDLRSPNIFLVSTNPQHEICAKVADFGLSRIVAPNLAGALGTWQWLAPEVFNANESDRYDECADRFSFAIVCWEIATRQFPYAEYEQNPKYSLQRADGSWELNVLTIKQAIVNGLRPTFPSSENIPVDFQNLIKRCWSSNPKKRPHFDFIISELERLIDPSLIPDFEKSKKAKALEKFTEGSKRFSFHKKPKGGSKIAGVSSSSLSNSNSNSNSKKDKKKEKKEKKKKEIKKSKEKDIHMDAPLDLSPRNRSSSNAGSGGGNTSLDLSSTSPRGGDKKQKDGLFSPRSLSKRLSKAKK